MTFFNKVIANESKNRMSIWNISTVMAPNLFFSRSKHSDYEELLLANTAAHIIRLTLKYQKILWKVSNNAMPVMFSSPQKSTSTQEMSGLLEQAVPAVTGRKYDKIIPGCLWHLYPLFRAAPEHILPFKQES